MSTHNPNTVRPEKLFFLVAALVFTMSSLPGLSGSGRTMSSDWSSTSGDTSCLSNLGYDSPAECRATRDGKGIDAQLSVATQDLQKRKADDPLNFETVPGGGIRLTAALSPEVDCESCRKAETAEYHKDISKEDAKNIVAIAQKFLDESAADYAKKLKVADEEDKKAAALQKRIDNCEINPSGDKLNDSEKIKCQMDKTVGMSDADAKTYFQKTIEPQLATMAQSPNQSDRDSARSLMSDMWDSSKISIRGLLSNDMLPLLNMTNTAYSLQLQMLSPYTQAAQRQQILAQLVQIQSGLKQYNYTHGFNQNGNPFGTQTGTLDLMQDLTGRSVAYGLANGSMGLLDPSMFGSLLNTDLNSQYRAIVDQHGNLINGVQYVNNNGQVVNNGSNEPISANINGHTLQGSPVTFNNAQSSNFANGAPVTNLAGRQANPQFAQPQPMNTNTTNGRVQYNNAAPATARPVFGQQVFH